MKKNIKAQNAVETLGIFARNICFRSVVFIAFAAVTSSFVMAKTSNDNKPTITLYSTSFEQPTFQVGDQLLGLDNWSTAIPPFLNPEAAKITRDAASHQKQSVEIFGADLIGSEGITAPYDAVGSYRRPLDQTINAKNSRVHVDADLLLETNQDATPGQFFSLTIAARSGNGETLGEVGLSSEGVAEAFDFNAIPGAAPTFFTPISLNQWHHISMLIDYENRTTSYYIDDQYLGTVDAPSTSNVLARVAMVVYARPDGDASGGEDNNRSNYAARFDKFRVRVNSAQN
ncbi:hypothetical protein GO003_017765 [Methylicorpusculum oleiharenae]|uniref:hypothetical protein n=1 Tax=Methylicorpusculum oleiharenae TaxID=1338687 RepID=UPI001358290C|nr:hypothetical protein [Methylicorpusculum oleiharenae]MCD2452239.1 hypothetical protein [Methylicorpusculum oleiharenae]